MSSLDIVKLIEKNSITRLSKDYEHQLLNKIKEVFTDIQQQLFVSTFYCYLNYEKNDFVVNFDNIWKWIGFSRKDPAKRLLEKNFVIDIDYKVENIIPQESGKMEKGRPSERILLTVKTFKKFCMKAETKKADEIHDYYIKLEELLQETINEESDELRNQLEEKSKQYSELESKHEKVSKYKHEKKNKSGNCLYIVSIKDKFKVGMTKNIDERLKDLNTSSPYQFNIMEIYYTNFNVTLEKLIKEVFSNERISINCEWYKLSALDKIKEFIDIQLDVYNKYESERSEVINEIEEKIVEIDNQKRCNQCHEVFHVRKFFYIDREKRIYRDECISCYVKENEDSKQCTDCDQIKPKYTFIIDRTKTDGLTYDCKECRIKTNNDIKQKNVKNNENLGKKKCDTCEIFQEFKYFFKKDHSYIGDCKNCYNEKNGQSKQCFSCNEIKLIDQYMFNRNTTDGLCCYCKECTKIKVDKQRENIRKINLEKNKKECKTCEKSLDHKLFFRNVDSCKSCYTPESLQCNKCDEIKEYQYFSKDSSKKTGYRTICKKCTLLI
jgi:hypothetical protein